VALTEEGYVTSEQNVRLLQRCCDFLNETHEHHCYQLGQAAFDRLARHDKIDFAKTLLPLYGEAWRSQRYHHLVRLGGDAVRLGLADTPRVVLLGALQLAKSAEA
jgi:hypothetical protein